MRYWKPEKVRFRAQEALEREKRVGKQFNRDVCLTADGQRLREELRVMGVVEPADVIRRLLDAEEENARRQPRPPRLLQRVEVWKKKLEELENPVLREVWEVVPVKRIPLRVAKYDVVFEKEPLDAVRAMHAIVGQMVMFRCECCNERFPTFHPAYEPPEELNLELLKRGQGGRIACSVEVERWNDVPPLRPVGEQLLAGSFDGTCRSCHLDMVEQQRLVAMAAVEELADGLGQAEPGGMVLKRSERNWMDPCWQFPYQECAQLFEQATVTESMLVALEHMQVNYVTVGRSRLDKFCKNVIFFLRRARVS